MRNILLLTGVLTLSGCTTYVPVPPEIKQAVAQIPEEKLPLFPMRERDKCTMRLHHTELTRKSCVIEVRRERLARQMMEQRSKAQANSNGLKE